MAFFRKVRFQKPSVAKAKAYVRANKGRSAVSVLLMLCAVGLAVWLFVDGSRQKKGAAKSTLSFWEKQGEEEQEEQAEQPSPYVSQRNPAVSNYN